MDNYNDKSLMENGNCKWEFKEVTPREKKSIMRVMLSYSQIGYQKLTLKGPTSKERNQRKELSIKELRDDIKWVVTKTKFQICYVRIIEIVNE